MKDSNNFLGYVYQLIKLPFTLQIMYFIRKLDLWAAQTKQTGNYTADKRKVIC